MFKRIEQPSITQEIMRQIKQQIAQGTLKKGDRLPSERRLAEMFGISRASTREALKVLEMMGLVKCVQGSGTFIGGSMESSLTQPLSVMFLLEQGSLSQVLEIRRALEVTAAALAAQYADADVTQELERLCAQIEAQPDEQLRVQADRAFHYTIARAAQNPLLSTMLNASSVLIENLIADARQRMLGSSTMGAEINMQHRSIVSAIKSKNAPMAEAAMRAHMDAIAHHLVQK